MIWCRADTRTRDLYPNMDKVAMLVMPPWCGPNSGSFAVFLGAPAQPSLAYMPACILLDASLHYTAQLAQTLRQPSGKSCGPPPAAGSSGWAGSTCCGNGRPRTRVVEWRADSTVRHLAAHVCEGVLHPEPHMPRGAFP